MIYQFIITAVLTAAADQYVKFLVKTQVKLYSSIIVIPDIFNITYVENYGIALGLTGQDGGPVKRWILCGVIFAAIVLIVLYWAKHSRKSFLFNFSLGLITGGAAGNLIDRVLRGSVTDFLDFSCKGFSCPVFNTADAAVTAGVLLFIIYLVITKEHITGGTNASHTV